MIQEIYIIDDDESSILVFRELFKNDKDFKFISVKSEQIELALKNIPSMIIINEDAIKIDVIELCKRIRKDDDNSITPIIVVSSREDKEHRIKILKEAVEYYIRKPVDAEYLYYTIKNVNRLLAINRRISPLTGLPGNVQIHAELKKRIANKETFSVLYLDLDNFKAYNDVYGFLKGDEIIKFTANVILQCVHSYVHEGAFVGHIGGDDFIAIIPITSCEELCQNIIANFDSQVTKFFTEEDAEKGYIEVANRKGIIEQFPLTAISIGVVEVDKNRFTNMLEIGEVGAQVKHSAKNIMGSSYVIDRRKNSYIPNKK
jgi:diguanylate cyclase (GGDEF)-like protein